MPASATGAGPKPASASVAALAPALVGANATVTSQLPPAASVALLHVSAVLENWLALEPPTVTAPSV